MMKTQKMAFVLLASLEVIACSHGGGSTSSAQDKELNEVKTQLTQKSEEIQRLISEKEEAKQQLVEKENALTQATETAKQLNQTNAEKDAKVQSLQDEVNEAKRQLVEKENALTQATETAKQLNQTNAEKDAKVQSLQDEVNDAKQKLIEKEKVLANELNNQSKDWRYLGAKPENKVSYGIGRTINTVTIELHKYPASDEVVKIPVIENGVELGNIHAINQVFSSYTQYAPAIIEKLDEARFVSGSDFVFLPTDPTKSAFVKNGGKATYRGKALDTWLVDDNGVLNETEITPAKFTLEVDFANKTVEGSVTERVHRGDITLHKTAITESVDTPHGFTVDHLGFTGIASRLTSSGNERRGTYTGFFAGDNAEEVVGSIDGTGGQVTFGGKR